MTLGNSLSAARKKSGMSQEEAAERLGVSRQTISKWETDETLPDIRQSKILASLYRLSLDELICFDAELQEIRRTIDSSSPERDREVDWTALWAQKYPVLASYRQQVRTEDYAASSGPAGPSEAGAGVQRAGRVSSPQGHTGNALDPAGTAVVTHPAKNARPRTPWARICI